MQNDKATGSTVCGLLKKISHSEFSGMLYLLKNILPSLAGLTRISPSINRCKSKILEVAKDYRLIEQLKKDLHRKLKYFERIWGNPYDKFGGKIWKINVQQYWSKIYSNSMQHFRAICIFNIELLSMSSSPSFCVYAKNEVSLSAENFFPVKSIEIIMIKLKNLSLKW